VESPQNRAAREARDLERDRAARDGASLYLAWGVHLAREALDAGAPIARAFVSKGIERGAEGRDLLARLESTGADLLHTTDRVLESIAPGAGDQGVLLVVRRPPHDLSSILATGPTLLLLLHGVQDPGNVGSIARTALALGAQALVALDGSADPFSSRAARAAMGALFRLPVVSAKAVKALPAIQGAGLTLVAADAAGGRSPSDLDLRKPTAILLGSEGRGLPEELLRAATDRTHVAMTSAVASLNVHAAATVLLYEAARQRGGPAR
jgi:TrmH family RNA methyltransferase